MGTSTFSQFVGGGQSATAPNGIFPGYGSAQYFLPTGIAESAARTLTANRLYGMPFFCKATKSFTAISVYQSGAGTTGNIRLGIYADSSGLPGSLVQDCGAVAFPGSTGFRTVTTTISLNGGTWYWLAGVADAALIVAGWGNIVTGAPVGDMVADHGLSTAAASTLDFSTNLDGYLPIYAAFTYGVLSGANPFPTYAGYTGSAPIIALKG